MASSDGVSPTRSPGSCARPPWAFLAPIFFVTAGFAVTLQAFQDDLLLLIALVTVATLGKIIGTALFYLPSGHGWREGLVLGGSMNGRGAVEIIMAGIGLQLGLINESIFSVLVFMAIFTTATVPVLLKLGADWLRRRGELVRIGSHRRGTLIIGASPLALQLARVLAADEERVTVIDTNEERIAQAKALGLPALCADALQEGELGNAGAEDVALVVAMTPNPTVNMLAAQIASAAHDVPDVLILQVDELTSGRASALRLLGAATLFGQRVPIRELELALVGAELSVTEVAYTAAEREGWGWEQRRLPLAWRREGSLYPYSDHARPREGDPVLVLAATSTVQSDAGASEPTLPAQSAPIAG